MNKKGTHVDWVVSMGIFIIYIFVLFILLRPGSKPIYRPTALLDNLEKQFYEDAGWVVKQVPLFVRVCPPSVELQPSTIKVETGNAKWTFNKAVNRANAENVGSTGSKFSYTCLAEGNPEIVDMTLSQDGVYDKKEALSFLPVDCTFPDKCDVQLGIIEDIDGVDVDVVSSFDYSILKSEWGIPPEKEFAIYIDENINGEYEYIIEDKKPYEQANVFVRRIDDQFVDKFGGKTPIAVYLRIW